MKRLLAGGLMLCSLQNFAQDVKNAEKPNPFTISGYVEAYYGYDFNKPADNNRPGFIYSHNRHNEFNLNLGYLKGAYNSERVRANLALAAGTYMNANYAAEPGVLKNIYEADAGIKISKKKNLWIDAGIMPSHIGFESAVSKDCYTLTRSLLAENSPYYEAGAKITYTSDNNKWLLSGLALNGWQRIIRVSGNSLMSFGTQLQYKPNSIITLNYSTFIGTDKPDSARLMRYFHDVYGIFSLGKLGVIAGFDIGQEQVSKGSSDLNTWYSPILILKYSLSGKWAMAARMEYYQDEHGVIIATGTPNGFKTTGFSLNLDYLPVSNAVVRIEARSLNSKDDIFVKDGQLKAGNTAVTASIAVSF
ncbi:porin [Flavihumibacter profundi]|uniref:porin n=1 Tax=Flavihumibacter profundi TaxID=2716883 RepID=UPI001CC7BDFB|nr:porin [Flavihumibacter profundi]MBZ5858611.1 porin [Flavihumibacter profundi]